MPMLGKSWKPPGSSEETEPSFLPLKAHRARAIQERETDPRRLSQRQKQVGYGKITQGYLIYIKEVDRDKRTRNDPWTPDIHRKYSKRVWDSTVRSWRRQLHRWDPYATSEYLDASSYPHGKNQYEDYEDEMLESINDDIQRFQKQGEGGTAYHESEDEHGFDDAPSTSLNYSHHHHPHSMEYDLYYDHQYMYHGLEGAAPRNGQVIGMALPAASSSSTASDSTSSAFPSSSHTTPLSSPASISSHGPYTGSSYTKTPSTVDHSPYHDPHDTHLPYSPFLHPHGYQTYHFHQQTTPLPSETPFTSLFSNPHTYVTPDSAVYDYLDHLPPSPTQFSSTHMMMMASPNTDTSNPHFNPSTSAPYVYSSLPSHTSSASQRQVASSSSASQRYIASPSSSTISPQQQSTCWQAHYQPHHSTSNASHQIRAHPTTTAAVTASFPSQDENLENGSST